MLFKKAQEETEEINVFEEEVYILVDDKLIKVEEGENNGNIEKGNE